MMGHHQQRRRTTRQKRRPQSRRKQAATIYLVLFGLLSSTIIIEIDGFSTTFTPTPPPSPSYSLRHHYHHHHHHQHHHCHYRPLERYARDESGLINRRRIWKKDSILSATTPSSSSTTENTDIGRSKNELVVDEFVQRLYDSITFNEQYHRPFISLTLYGVKRPPTTSSDDVESVRGCIRQVQGRLIQKKNKNKKKQKQSNRQPEAGELLLQLTFKYHLATDIVKNVPMESLTSEISAMLMTDPDNIRNTASSGGLIASEWGDEQVSSQPIRRAELVILGGRTGKKNATKISELWELQLDNSKKPSSLKRRAVPKNHPSQKEIDSVLATMSDNNQQHQQDQTPSSSSVLFSHDRKKNVPLSTKDDVFLQKLGITTSDGKPRKGMQSKLRQCQKFVEIVSGLVSKSISSSSSSSTTPTTTTTAATVTQKESNNDNDSENQQVQQPNENNHSRPLQIVDMGCGRGYLTFSLHSYLCSTYGKDNVSTLGIDVRPKLVNEMNGITNDLGGSFDTLTFEEGTIEDVVGGVDAAERKNTNGSGVDGLHENDDSNDLLQVLVALHACDTATDDAIWYGIARGVDVIVVAPCCHKQVRPQLDAHYVSTRKTGHPLGEILRHGIYRERHSETVTDSIRALLLELAGYKVQVFEFIGGEHTSKNVMLSAVKTQWTSPETKELTIKEIRSLTSFHGIRKQKLADWMGVTLLEEDQSSLLEQQHSSIFRMPPRSSGAQTEKY